MAGRLITSLFLVLLGLAGCNSFDGQGIRQEHAETYPKRLAEMTEDVLAEKRNG